MHFVWFSMRDGFLATHLRISPSIWIAVVRKIHLTWKTIQNVYRLFSHHPMSQIFSINIRQDHDLSNHLRLYANFPYWLKHSFYGILLPSFYLHNATFRQVSDQSNIQYWLNWVDEDD